MKASVQQEQAGIFFLLCLFSKCAGVGGVGGGGWRLSVKRNSGSAM